jgi:antitoxin component YwqK of YwqJK toxin-antitoxin module
MQDKRPTNEQSQAHGYWEVYYESGSLKSKGEYINGKAIGIHESFFSDGCKDEYLNYINDNLYYIESHAYNGGICYKGHYTNETEIGYWVEDFASSPDEHFYYAK